MPIYKILIHTYTKMLVFIKMQQLHIITKYCWLDQDVPRYTKSFNVLVRCRAQMNIKYIHIYKSNNRYSATYRVYDNDLSYNQVQS